MADFLQDILSERGLNDIQFDGVILCKCYPSDAEVDGAGERIF